MWWWWCGPGRRVRRATGAGRGQGSLLQELLVIMAQGTSEDSCPLTRALLISKEALKSPLGPVYRAHQPGCHTNVGSKELPQYQVHSPPARPLVIINVAYGAPSAKGKSPLARPSVMLMWALRSSLRQGKKPTTCGPSSF